MTHEDENLTYFAPDPAHSRVVPTQVAGYFLSVTDGWERVGQVVAWRGDAT